MHEILRILAPGSRVLDLGSGAGSFDAPAYPLLRVIRADLERPVDPPENFVQCSAAELPFPDRSFDAVISNHSFEHFENLDASVKELGRILAPRGMVFIAVPDSSTFTDRVYRWLARGGGHVNHFSDAGTLPRMITASAGLKLAATRVLCTSLSFMNRRNFPSRAPRRMLLFGNGREGAIRALVFVLRTLDRWFGTRASVYGWGYWFGEVEGVETSVASNVCVSCGSAHSTAALESVDRVARRRFLPDVFICPVCGTRNFHIDDRYFQGLR
jgi:SAM-dependent methyltransferase